MEAGCFGTETGFLDPRHKSGIYMDNAVDCAVTAQRLSCAHPRKGE